MSDHSASNLAVHAGVRVPPPLIYVVIFGLGFVLHQIAPISFVPRLPVRVAAAIFLGGYVLLVGWSNCLFRRAHTSMVPVRPSTALVVTGPYRLTRNPMYVSLLCVYIALSLWFGVIWALLFIPT